MDVKITDNSAKTLQEFENAVKRGLDACGMTAEGYAKKETPVDTGRLRNSISYLVKDETVYIGTNVEYAPHIELGTVHIAPHHMLKDATQNHSSEYKSLIMASLGAS